MDSNKPIMGEERDLEIVLHPDKTWYFLRLWIFTGIVLLVDASIFVYSYKFGLVILAVSCAVLGVMALNMYLTWKYTRYIITSFSLITESGIIWKYHADTPRAKIQNIYINQGLIQRLLKVGDMGFSTAGESHVEVQWVGIKNPYKLKEKIH